MNNFIFIILLLSFSVNISDQENIYDDDKKIDLINKDLLITKDVVTEKYFNYKKDDDDEEDDPGNPDNHAIIVRPCTFFDIFCIRKFFAEHSKCKIVPGPVKEPFYVAENQIYAPNSNITVDVINIQFVGLNGRVDEFYINKATGNLVLSVFFKGVKADAIPTYVRFNRNGAESIEIRSVAAVDYAKMTVTTVIPNYKNLRLEDAEINGYLDDPVPPFVIIPTTPNVADPTALGELAELIADVPTAAIENLFTVSPLVAKIFIQRNICDFGVPINRL